MASRIGVYFDQQNIGGGLDCEALAAMVKTKWGVLTPVVKVYPVLAEAVADIQADITANELNGVLICGPTPRLDWEIYQFGAAVQVERVNMQEHVVHACADLEQLPKVAADYVNMGVVKLQKSEIPDSAAFETVKRVLVVGGGWTGLTAALEASKTGYEVVLVEKTAALGGKALNMPRTSPLQAPWKDMTNSGLEAKLAEVSADSNITVYTEASIAKMEGQPGDFTCTIATSGRAVEVKVGSAVLATGWTPLDNKYLESMGLGKLQGVTHMAAFAKTMLGGTVPAKRVAFVLDTTMAEEMAAALAASAEAAPAEAPAGEKAKEELEETGFVKQDLESLRHLRYSNAVNSVAAMRLANLLCEQKEDAVQVFILYKDMTIPGILERFYKEMQNRLGIMMTKCDVTDIREENDHLVVECKNTLLGMDFDLDVDTVVLPTGIVPTTAKEAVMQFSYRQGPDFPDLDLFDGFSDSNYICFPYETRRTGVYAAGCVRQPMTMDQCAEDACGAVLKAVQCIEAADHGVAVHPRSGDTSYPVFNFVRCTQCKRCTEECPFGALDDDEKGTPKPNPARCRRCGTCFGACPERVISFANYNIDQIGSMIREVEVPKDFRVFGPRILILACENDAYPALDMAAMRNKPWSPYVRIIPVRCLGSINAIWVSDAMSKGYDGVMLMGCKYGDDYQCHFIKGSEICNRRKENIAETLNRLGVEPERVEQFELAIDEYDKVPAMIDGFVEHITRMGPNPFKGM